MAIGVAAKFKAYVDQAGGKEIFAWKLLRLLGTVVLLGLSITTFVEDSSQDGHLSIFSWGDDPKLEQERFANFSIILTYAYTSILALWILFTDFRRVRYASTYLNAILFTSWAVFFYRDIWPLGTYDRVPLDIPLDRFFWPKFILLTITGVVTPLLIPTPYTPVDPENPSDEPAPEQTASLLSMMLFSFLDPLIWAGYRTTHLAYDRLPPLADYDRASWLKQLAFQHLDPFITGKKRHVLWGFMRIFKKDFGQLVLLVIVRTATMFFAPIALNRLLAYIETGGSGATVRPWVWIVLIAIGPLAGSIATHVCRILYAWACADDGAGVHLYLDSRAHPRGEHFDRACF